jgi:FkbM family methyltransferase
MADILTHVRSWSGPAGKWVTEAPVGTARYRLCLAALLARRAPTALSQAHLMTAALIAPARDRVPWLRDRWQTVRLFEAPHQVTWTVGPATDFDVLGEVLVHGEYDNLGLDSPGVILDIGSHIGASILRLHTKYPGAQIYGFEPDPATFSRLVRNVAQLQRVTVLPWAIGGANGQTAFYPRRQSWVSSVQPEHGASPVTVECVALDTAIERLGVTQIDLVKIDVEGAEASILARFRGLAAVVLIVGELHGESICSEVLALLTDFAVETHGEPDHCHFRARRRT